MDCVDEYYWLMDFDNMHDLRICCPPSSSLSEFHYITLDICFSERRINIGAPLLLYKIIPIKRFSLNGFHETSCNRGDFEYGDSVIHYGHFNNNVFMQPLACYITINNMNERTMSCYGTITLFCLVFSRDYTGSHTQVTYR